MRHPLIQFPSHSMFALGLLAMVACSAPVGGQAAPVPSGPPAPEQPGDAGDGGKDAGRVANPPPAPLAETTPLVANNTGRYFQPMFTAALRTNDVVYGQAPDHITNALVDLKLDVYQPDGDAAATRPAMVWVHGGGFRGGDKSSGTVDKVEAWTKRGYVMVSINYRLWPDNRCQDLQDERLAEADRILWTTRCLAVMRGAQYDAQAAVRWLRKNAAMLRLDVGRVGVIGGSAGGIVSMNVAHGGDDPGTSGNPGFDSRVAVSLSISGGQYELSRITADDAPMIDIHATLDPTVPYAASKTAIDASNAVGVPAKLLSYVETSHANTTYANHFAEAEAAFTQFAADHLKLMRP